MFTDWDSLGFSGSFAGGREEIYLVARAKAISLCGHEGFTKVDPARALWLLETMDPRGRSELREFVARLRLSPLPLYTMDDQALFKLVRGQILAGTLTAVQPDGTAKHWAVRTGNANIDHAFVVYNLKVEKVILTRTTATNNTRERLADGKIAPPGWEIKVWDLRKTIANNAPQVGYVMDPYLDASIMRPTAKQLLDALNSPKRKKDHKDTDFLAFSEATSASYTVDDIRGKTDAERKALVKNV
jgi:hypothetical protein